MTYKIGTRVKKVRGLNMGATGVVCEKNVSFLYEYDPEYCMSVRYDGPWVSERGDAWGPEQISATSPAWWEPILDRHTPCESDFKESLDKLLSEVRHASVE